ncbi:MAG: hypothetical protein Kow0089_12080 [Desulfobulbaceae bacterium]
MSGRTVKKEVLRLLAGDDLEKIRSTLAAMDPAEVLHGLFSGICSSDERLHWNSVACMGPVVARLAERDMEEARIVMRRLLWSLNDESGGIGWGAPETMAEIMVHHRGLAEEYIHMLISYMREDGEELHQDGNFLEHEVLQRGLLWGIGRLAQTRPGMLRERNVQGDLSQYLESNDPGVRGLAARAAGLLGVEEAADRLIPLLEDTRSVRFLEEDEIRQYAVGELAGQALQRLAGERVK